MGQIRVSNSAVHDEAGNQITEGAYSSTFDAEGRMVSNTLNSGVTRYVYDGDGRRVMKQNWLGTITYVYDAGGNLAAEYTAATQGAVFPSGMTNPCGTQTCYVTVDHLGSTRLVTDSNGNVARRYDYLPSGEEIPVGTGGRTAALGYQFGQSQYAAFGNQDGFNPKFTGQMRDWESGLDYFNARYYSPAQGRFVAPDPDNAGADVTNPQTWNGYAYVGNNPLTYTDPRGLGFWSDLADFLSSIFGGGSGNGIGSIPGIGGVNSGPWNEQIPYTLGSGASVNTGGVFGGGSNGPFVFDYNPIYHGVMGGIAARSAGLSILDALAYGIGVVGVDFWKGSQRTDPSHTAWHAMGGTTTVTRSTGLMAPRSRSQTCGQAYLGTVSAVAQATELALTGDSYAAELAGHTIQDSYASGHGYQNWPGGIPGVAHLVGDLTPSAIPIAKTTEYLLGLQGKATLRSPEYYIAPRPSGCK